MDANLIVKKNLVMQKPRNLSRQAVMVIYIRYKWTLSPEATDNNNDGHYQFMMLLQNESTYKAFVDLDKPVISLRDKSELTQNKNFNVNGTVNENVTLNISLTFSSPGTVAPPPG